MDGGEREQPAILGSRDDRGGLPPVPAELVVSAEAGTGNRGACPVEPGAAVTLRAPLAHASDVGDEPVHVLGGRGDLDASGTPFRGRHDRTLARGWPGTSGHGRRAVVAHA